MDRRQQIERSIIKKYRKTIWNPFIGALKTYRMIQAEDRIAVCISGGKDSMLLAKCLQELQRHGSEVPFSLEFLVMDPGYAPENRRRIEENVALLGLDIHIFDSPIFSVVEQQEEGSPCYLCARMRRGYLYKFAQDLGCNKIALGHHHDDVIETILMSMLYGAEARTMMPKIHSRNYPGMELIRPLYLVKERDIQSWVRYNDLSFLRCACATADRDAESESKRAEIKALIATLRKTNPQVEDNIFHSMENVNLETVLGYYKGNHAVSFLEDYDA